MLETPCANKSSSPGRGSVCPHTPYMSPFLALSRFFLLRGTKLPTHVHQRWRMSPISRGKVDTDVRATRIR